MATVSLYLNFAGRTEEVFLFYKEIFGGAFRELKRFSDVPFGAQLPEAERGKVMHVSYPIGNIVLMGTDTLESQGHTLTIGNNFSICVDADDKAHADRLFAALGKDGTVTMPLQDTFWGGYFGMCVDRYGVQWMIQWIKYS
jgi:PhnB protein